jgi:hypothetical protein
MVLLLPDRGNVSSVVYSIAVGKARQRRYLRVERAAASASMAD